MTDAAQTARGDLAFLKAVVDDNGPMPWIFGAHLLTPGLAFGGNFILIWAIYAGRMQWPSDWMNFTWLPGTIVYLPILAVLLVMGARGPAPGPTGRVFAAAWGTVGLMSAATVSVLVIASYRAGMQFVMVWPPLIFVLYGGAWSVVAFIRRQIWLGLVALGSFITASIAAATMTTPEVWLVDAAGILLVMAAPGAAIIWRARGSG